MSSQCQVIVLIRNRKKITNHQKIHECNYTGCFEKNETRIIAKLIILCVEDSLISQHSNGNDTPLHGLNKE